MAEQQENAPNDCQQAHRCQQKEIVFEWSLREVVANPQRTGKNEQASEDQDWQGAFHLSQSQGTSRELIVNFAESKVFQSLVGKL